MTKPFVVIRPITGRFHVNAYEGWDRTNRRRVVVHRHYHDAAARNEFAALEKTAVCDQGLVVGSAFHRLCFDSEVDFGDFDDVHTPVSLFRRTLEYVAPCARTGSPGTTRRSPR